MARRAPWDRGFTLIELIVVVLILGILAAIGVPQYLKTMETSKADDAVATVAMLGQANRMYNANNDTQTSGNWIASASPVDNNSGLITNKYIAAQNWSTKAYDFYTCDPTTGNGGSCCAVGLVACAARKAGSNSAYANWGYTVDTNGVVTATGGAPAPTS